MPVIYSCDAGVSSCLLTISQHKMYHTSEHWGKIALSIEFFLLVCSHLKFNFFLDTLGLRKESDVVICHKRDGTLLTGHKVLQHLHRWEPFEAQFLGAQINPVRFR